MCPSFLERLRNETQAKTLCRTAQVLDANPRKVCNLRKSKKFLTRFDRYHGPVPHNLPNRVTLKNSDSLSRPRLRGVCMLASTSQRKQPILHTHPYERSRQENASRKRHQNVTAWDV